MFTYYSVTLQKHKDMNTKVTLSYDEANSLKDYIAEAVEEQKQQGEQPNASLLSVLDKLQQPKELSFSCTDNEEDHVYNFLIGTESLQPIKAMYGFICAAVDEAKRTGYDLTPQELKEYIESRLADFDE